MSPITAGPEAAAGSGSRTRCRTPRRPGLERRENGFPVTSKRGVLGVEGPRHGVGLCRAPFAKSGLRTKREEGKTQKIFFNGFCKKHLLFCFRKTGKKAQLVLEQQNKHLPVIVYIFVKKQEKTMFATSIDYVMLPSNLPLEEK